MKKRTNHKFYTLIFISFHGLMTFIAGIGRSGFGIPLGGFRVTQWQYSKKHFIHAIQ